MRRLAPTFLLLFLLPCMACKGPGLGGFPKGTFGDLGEMKKSFSALFLNDFRSMGRLRTDLSTFWTHGPKLQEMKQGIQTLLHPSSDMNLRSAWDNFLILWSREQVSPWR